MSEAGVPVARGFRAMGWRSGSLLPKFRSAARDLAASRCRRSSRVALCFSARQGRQLSICHPSWIAPASARIGFSHSEQIESINIIHFVIPTGASALLFPAAAFAAGGRVVEGPAVGVAAWSRRRQKSLSSLKGLWPYCNTYPGFRCAPSWANGGSTPSGFGRRMFSNRCAGTAVSSTSSCGSDWTSSYRGVENATGQ